MSDNLPPPPPPPATASPRRSTRPAPASSSSTSSTQPARATTASACSSPSRASSSMRSPLLAHRGRRPAQHEAPARLLPRHPQPRGPARARDQRPCQAPGQRARLQQAGCERLQLDRARAGAAGLRGGHAALRRRLDRRGDREARGGDACDRGAAQRVGACPASRSISTCVPVSRAMVKPSRS